MNKLTELYQINGKPLPVPDADVQMSFEDLDAADSGRDESGVMHRIPVRYKVGSWQFSYASLTQEEFSYLRGVLPQAGSFTFTYPDPDDCTQRKSCSAYLSGYSVVWHSARTKLFHNLKFSVIQC